jgi:hypothetical protein
MARMKTRIILMSEFWGLFNKPGALRHLEWKTRFEPATCTLVEGESTEVSFTNSWQLIALGSDF